MYGKWGFNYEERKKLIKRETMTSVVVGEAPHEALQVMLLHRVQHLSSLCQLREKREWGGEAQHDLGVTGQDTELLEVVLALEKSKVTTGSSQPDQAQRQVKISLEGKA